MKTLTPKPSKPTEIQAQAVAQALYGGIVASAMDAIISVDEKQRILFFNPAAERMFGHTMQAVLGQPLELLIPLAVRNIHRSHIRAFAKAGTLTRAVTRPDELFGRRADGTEFAIEASIFQVRVAEKRIFTAIVRDVSERKRAQKALEQRAEYLRRLNALHQSILAASSTQAIAQNVLERMPELIGYSHSAILLPDAQTQALVVLATHPTLNTYLKEGLRFSLDSYQGKRGFKTSYLTGKIEQFADLAHARLPRPLLQLLSREKIRAFLDVPLSVDDKRIGVLHLYAQQPHVADMAELETAGQLANILAVALQQARLYEVINTTRERLHALARRQLELEELQRRKLSRELHDMVGQNLTALNINLYSIANKLPADAPDTIRTRLEDSSQLVEGIVEQIRNLMAELRPSILDDLGLTSALRWYAGEFSKRTELAVGVAVQELEPRLPPAAETALFRIAQEALTNVAKHAHAETVWVDLQVEDGEATLTVADDGAGFDFVAMRRDPSKRGVGIVDMRERAEAIGGRMWIECAPGKGTRVKVKLHV